MWELVKWLIIGHSHKWKIIKEIPLQIRKQDQVVAQGISYNLQCEGCGNIKTYNDINPGNY